jgi:hypothetical protein
MGWYGLDWSGSELGAVESSCEHCNEALGSIKCGSSSVAAQLAASQDGLSSMKLVSPYIMILSHTCNLNFMSLVSEN